MTVGADGLSGTSNDRHQVWWVVYSNIKKNMIYCVFGGGWANCVTVLNVSSSQLRKYVYVVGQVLW